MAAIKYQAVEGMKYRRKAIKLDFNAHLNHARNRIKKF
jgi:hypothetical protein